MKIVRFVLFIVAVAAAAFVLWSNYLPALQSPPNLMVMQREVMVDGEKSSQPVITNQDPFFELTIPGLRVRQYQSQLGALELVSEQTNYTSYLTSYQSDGFQVNGLLTKPKGEMPEGGWPAVVFIHGYIPPTQYRTQERYVAYVNYLASRGLVVFKIDLRGHGESEGEANGAYYSADYVIDALNARAALQAVDFVNPERIGLWGHSMAGNVVLRALVARPEIKAGVIWAGAVFSYADWQQYGLNDNSYRPPSTISNRQRRREALFAAHGQFDASNAFWQQVAPTTYLAEYTGALQLHHAVDDEVVNVGYSRDLSALAKQLELDFEYHEYPTGGHDIEGTSFTRAMERTSEWFLEKL